MARGNPVTFFTDDITIEPHTSNCAHLIGKPITLRKFSEGTPLSLWHNEETGDMYVENGQHLIAPGMPKLFIEGPEVQS